MILVLAALAALVASVILMITGQHLSDALTSAVLFVGLILAAGRPTIP